MDNVLKKLFDFQRFQGNDRMETLISETESRYGGTSKGLSDEELDFVNAAGEVYYPGTHEGAVSGNSERKSRKMMQEFREV